jgi:hypothetical protein
MMDNIEINETEISFRDERYSVRDNGYILRHSRSTGRKRKDDDTWTFGTSVDEKGFYLIGNQTVHSIIATAYCGVKPSGQHIVLHKNYNKKDNRSQNLMWVTKFQFHILQPNVQSQLKIVSKKKKLEDVLSNFESIKLQLPNNLLWMQSISQEEANKALEMFRVLKFDLKKDSEYKDIKSLTKNAVQRKNWWIKCEFPCCPKDDIRNTLYTYYENLSNNKLFCINDYYKTIIDAFSFNKDKTAIIIKGSDSEEESVKPWKLAEITLENSVYVHKNLGTFFKEDGANKYFTIAIGEEWLNGEVFDDFCS